MDLKEFKKKVEDIWEKIDFSKNSDEKNMIFLQSLKNICANALEGSSISEELEKEVKSNLFKVETHISDIKARKKDSFTPQNPFQSSRSNFQSNIGSTEQLDEVDPLQSVDSKQFDPSSSPILRQLSQRKNAGLAAPQKMKTPENKLNTEKNLTNQMGMNIEADNFPPILQVSNNTKPEPVKKWLNASLILSQLNHKILLEFNSNSYIINRYTFLSQKYNQSMPEGFFDSIDENEHCGILQEVMGQFKIIDPSDKQKTYFKNQFVTNQAMEIKDGEDFILPVIVNGNQASLKVVLKIH